MVVFGTSFRRSPLNVLAVCFVLLGPLFACASNAATVMVRAEELAPATTGVSYSVTLAATSSSRTSWHLVSGALPSGLRLNRYTGIIEGVPTESGIYYFEAEANTAGRVARADFTIKVFRPQIGLNFSEAECTWGSFANRTDLLFAFQKNLSVIRLPIAWERAQPKLNGPLDPTYVRAISDFIQTAGSVNLRVIVDVHNYARYDRNWAARASKSDFCTSGKGDVIGSASLPPSAFADLWSKLAIALSGTPGLAYYDLMNEPHDLGAAVWPNAAQAAVDAIRSVDMLTPIMVEGTGWASAELWTKMNGDLHIKDPANKIIYEAHLYFDADQTSTYSQSYNRQGAYPDLGVDRVQPFLKWLKRNNSQGFIGEFGIPNNDPLWLPVLDHFLTAIQAAGVGGTYWSYVFHSPSDPGWWPAAEQKRIINNGQLNPQMLVLEDHALEMGNSISH